MTREEEIKYASKDYVNYLLDKQEYHNENYTEDDIRQAFEKGVKWVDNHSINVWHDTIDWLEKQGEQKKQVHFLKFTFDDVLALQCCMETVKKVQEDKELYEQLNLIHNKIYDAYCFGKQGETSPILSNSSNTGKNKPKFDPKTLQPFDKILGRGDTESPWQYQRTWCCATFSHINNDVMYPIKTTGDSYKYAVPYNDDTKHLVGTTEEAPEYYRYWED